MRLPMGRDDRALGGERNGGIAAMRATRTGKVGAVTRLVPLAALAVLSLPGRLPAQPSPVSRGESRNVYGYDPTPDFIAFDPEYLAKHAKYARELRELQL